MREALDDLEAVTHGEARHRLGWFEAGRRTDAGWFAQLGTLADQGADGLVEFGDERRVAQR